MVDHAGSGSGRAALVAGARVLIFEDSPEMAEALSGTIRSLPGIEVVGCICSGAEASAKAEELRSHLILIDARMLRADIVEATRSIKERIPKNRVLLITTDPARVTSALDAGADGFVMKDARRQDLLQAIRILSNDR